MKIAILGFGVEGKSVKKYFENPAHPAEITIFDQFADADIDQFQLADYDLVFRTPSIKPRPGWSSVTKYFFDHCPAPIIGITGTKGKGTTCSLVKTILKNIFPEKTIHLIGNIGTPALDVLDSIKPEDIIIYELSSFQLWDLEKSPHVAAVLRIEPDHLDIHHDFDDYVNAKSHITKFQKPTDCCIFYSNNPDSKKIATYSPGKKIPYPINPDSPVFDKINDLLSNINIPGKHNQENAMAALLISASYLNLPIEKFLTLYSSAISTALKNFHGLPHRLEFIRELNGVKYYDDNYSSAFSALDVALKAFSSHPIILIAGGKDRGLDLSKTKSTIFKNPYLHLAILIGETAKKLAQAENPEQYYLANSLEEAVKVAQETAEAISTKSPIVLMSPGAASFDMFKNFNDRGEKFQKLIKELPEKPIPHKPKSANFKFLDYDFDLKSYKASFRYEDIFGTIFTENIQFSAPLTKSPSSTLTPEQSAALDRALFLSFVLIGTSYYKAHPTKTVQLDVNLDTFQADFFNHVYQEGLSQYAYFNHLKREDLAHFIPHKSSLNGSPVTVNSSATDYRGSGILSLQSGGKDSLLTASILKNQEKDFSVWYLSSSHNYPAILTKLQAPLQVATRTIDLKNLTKTGGNLGHVPVTYIVQSLGLIQAILNNQDTVITSIGREGEEPHAMIDDLPVNHQWSKTWAAEKLFSKYVKQYISPHIKVGSILRSYSEMKIAELFVNDCWKNFGHQFSSCNVANYRQKADNSTLSWCGHCAKCANSYLLFSPFLPAKELDKIFGGSLFSYPDLTDEFKGLLGVDHKIKPFECVGETAELRAAYHARQPDYPSLPFSVPDSDFNYESLSPSQNLLMTP